MPGNPKSNRSLLTAAEACRVLGVKPATLYAYVSRGLLRSEPSTRGQRVRLYLKADVDTLKARSRARSGHGPVAAGALRWGDPVLESGITCIESGMLHYRGHSIDSLVDAGVPFENVAELLWSGDLPDRPTAWPASAWATGTRYEGFGRRLSLLLAEHAAKDEDVEVELLDRTLSRARAVIRGAGQALMGAASGTTQPIAAAVARGVLRQDLPEAARAVDLALIVSADHELNPSTFAARIAASTGADYYACMQAALAAFSGRRHGLSPQNLAESILELKSERDASNMAKERWRTRTNITGFGHTLYPEGDPRASALLAAARVVANKRGGDASRALAMIDALVAAAAKEGAPPPTLDLGLVAVALTLGKDVTLASKLFALGRIAGWTAHVLEQRQQDFMLRPRARYVGRPLLAKA